MEGLDLHFSRLALIGVGLIGGSLARDLREGGWVDEVVGCSRTEETLRRAQALGVIDRGEMTPEKAAPGADLVVIATPLGVAAELTLRIFSHLPKGALVTDVGSAKASYVAAVEPSIPPGVLFVGGHPIAGTEDSGVAASRCGLFRGATCVLTPTARTSSAAEERAGDLWRAVGARVVRLAPEAHDRMLAAVSHLPHVLAYAAVNTIPEDTIESFAGGGFRDFSRIASSDPAMWRDICLSNRGPLLDWLEKFRKALEALEKEIDSCDGSALEESFRAAKEKRDRLMTQRNEKHGE